jgi:6-pyruvoyltetrahydropterin/6-carboxytetrahydropterin synthase
MILIKEFEFDAAHNLIHYHGKCERLHGHTYKLVVKLDGKPDKEGMIIDFIELKKIVNLEVIEKLDHTYINDLIKQPSAENIAVWVWNALIEKVKRDNCKLIEIEVWETKTSGIIYRGE